MGKHFEEDYEGEKFVKFTHRKSKGHKKGHQSKSDNSERKRWAFIMENEDLETDAPSPTQLISNTPVNVYPPRVEHQFSNNTHEIKGVKIDFDGVDNIQKVDNIKDGRKTYGIKFFFKGKKGLFRIIWFNSDMVSRNTSFDTEYAFWLQVRK